MSCTTDQDPEFRRVFYEELLPERRGKTLIVSSHDDRYFHIADRILRMRDGVVVEDRVAREAVTSDPFR